MAEQQKRPFKMATVIGASGMGKTSLLREWIAAWKKEHPHGVLEILDPTQDNWTDYGGVWPDTGPEDARGPEERAEEWGRALRVRRKSGTPPPAMVLLEDADAYLLGTPRGVWRDLFTTYRHWRADVIIVGRRTQDLPKTLLQSTSTLAIFKHQEVGALDYLRKYIGAKAVKQIPDEPHKYLEVDLTAGQELSIGTTKRLDIVTRADLA